MRRVAGNLEVQRFPAEHRLGDVGPSRQNPTVISKKHTTAGNPRCENFDNCAGESLMDWRSRTPRSIQRKEGLPEFV
jgi:hypothetical protein